ncbi:hypothetical protein ABIF68_004131 [Bradyrhizobium japonicum]|uniref:Uncharacterized protein n=1 Tax=Bradyrhizobium barranii subsp. barranii TaxID=2823807 RepID=A0A7Z0QDZ4_9BRAD|nr:MULTISPECIES: hypothetical protein [Bradyrhizobium]UGX91302.1 hypothetical protein G6321_00036810 [Bradyrhizobium barranii subsp. barranii]
MRLITKGGHNTRGSGIPSAQVEESNADPNQWGQRPGADPAAEGRRFGMAWYRKEIPS